MTATDILLSQCDAGTVACVQLRLTALRSALKKAAPMLRDLDILPRARAGRGLREGRPAPGSLAEGAINYSSAGVLVLASVLSSLGVTRQLWAFNCMPHAQA